MAMTAAAKSKRAQSTRVKRAPAVRGEALSLASEALSGPSARFGVGVGSRIRKCSTTAAGCLRRGRVHSARLVLSKLCHQIIQLSGITMWSFSHLVCLTYDSKSRSVVNPRCCSDLTALTGLFKTREYLPRSSILPGISTQSPAAEDRREAARSLGATRAALQLGIPPTGRGRPGPRPPDHQAPAPVDALAR